MTKILFPNEKIITTKYFEVAQDREIPIPGFFIIGALRKDIQSITDFTDAEAQEYIKLMITIRKGMKEILNIDEVYFFQNEDTEHRFHLRIFPRHKRMEKFGRKIQSVRPIMEYAKEHMLSEEIFEEVRDYVRKMKKSLSSQQF